METQSSNDTAEFLEDHFDKTSNHLARQVITELRVSRAQFDRERFDQQLGDITKVRLIFNPATGGVGLVLEDGINGWLLNLDKPRERKKNDEIIRKMPTGFLQWMQKEGYCVSNKMA